MSLSELLSPISPFSGVAGMNEIYKRFIKEAKQFFRLDLNLSNIGQYVPSTSINELQAQDVRSNDTRTR